MLKLISAPPRSGKSLFAMQKIVEYLNKGRVVYTNINGVTLPGVLTYVPEDWRDAPNGSVLIYDECQFHPAFAKDDLITDKAKMRYYREDIMKALTIHGHFDLDIILITQSPQFLHPVVLELCSVHWHLKRLWGWTKCTVYQWGEGQSNPKTKSVQQRCENTFTWNYPKWLYNYYHSAEAHDNITNRLPLKYVVVVVLCLIVLLRGFVGLFFEYNKRQHPAQSQPVAASSPAPASAPAAQLDDPAAPAAARGSDNEAILQALELKRPALIVSDSLGHCTAKNRYGMPLQLSPAECLQFAGSPGRLMYGSMTASPEVAPAPASSAAEPSAPLQTKI